MEEKKQKRILIVSPYGFNDRMASFIEFTVGRVLAEDGWTVTAIVKSDNDISSVDTTCGITVYRYVSLLEGLGRVLRVFVFSCPQIVHIHNLRNNRIGIITSILAKFVRVPLLFTEYGLLHDHYITHDREDPIGKPIHGENVIASTRKLLKYFCRGDFKRWGYFLKSYIFHWPLTHASSVIFVSKHNFKVMDIIGLKNYVYLPQIMDEYRWTYKEVGLDQALVRHHGEVSKKLEVIKNDKNVLFIGQIKLRKGWDVLLKSIPHISALNVKNFIVISATADKEPREFTALADSLGVRDRVIFLGRVSNGEILKNAYEVSSAVIVPSRYEGFGLIPVEAFEMRKPVIASDVEALNEFLIHGYNALLVPPRDELKLSEAINLISTDKDLFGKLINGGGQTLEKMKSGEYKKRWLNYYEKFLPK